MTCKRLGSAASATGRAEGGRTRKPRTTVMMAATLAPPKPFARMMDVMSVQVVKMVK
jgi:hypothetical protein